MQKVFGDEIKELKFFNYKYYNFKGVKHLISKTGYLIKLNFNNGEIIEIVKFLQKSLGSNVLFANNKIFALDSQKKLFEY